MAYLLSNICTKITGIEQLLLKLSLVVGWYPFLRHSAVHRIVSFFITQVHILNGISIGSAVFAGFTTILSEETFLGRMKYGVILPTIFAIWQLVGCVCASV